MEMEKIHCSAINSISGTRCRVQSNLTQVKIKVDTHSIVVQLPAKAVIALCPRHFAIRGITPAAQDCELRG